MTTQPQDVFYPPLPSSQELSPLRLIPLELMPQQASAGPGCDWTGIGDPKQRKRIQDRIHQKTRRHRKKTMINMSSRTVAGGFGGQTMPPPTNISFGPITPITGPAMTFPGYSMPSQHAIDLSSFTACEPDSERTEWFIQHFTAIAHQNLSHGSARLDMLLSLIQFNTTRALVINARVMGISSEFMLPGSRSRLTCKDINGPASNSLPPSLHPTPLQLTQDHHPWVDILPFPNIRDNLLLYDENSYDKGELCRDLRGFQVVQDARGGMIAWGDSWNPHNWEVTQAFAAKWPWVVRDCFELLASTNRWRAIRGEPALTLPSKRTSNQTQALYTTYELCTPDRSLFTGRLSHEILPSR